MSPDDRFADTKLIRLQLCLYLLPIAGIVPAIWQLQRSPQTGLERRQYRLSQRSLQMTVIWLASYVLLWGGSNVFADVSSLRLLYLNGLITSGYFLLCFGWMARIYFQPLPPSSRSPEKSSPKRSL